jgi:ATP-dependent DNA helicase RecG
MNIKDVVEKFRTEHTDNAEYEAKRALKGFPDSTIETISAFANTPRGGKIIFGLDENANFKSVGVYDIGDCQQRIANLASGGVEPIVNVVSEVIEFEGGSLVVATVSEADLSIKPVKVKSTGISYIRQFDGDFPLSKIEEQLFISNRGASHFDQVIIETVNEEDINEVAINKYLENRRTKDEVLKTMSDKEILVRTGVINNEGKYTTAGILTFGKYPQQFITHYAIQASVKVGNGVGVRVIDPKYISGSIPIILDTAVDWVAKNGGTYLETLENGNVISVNKFPEIAVRELISNALIHRDLNPLSLGTPISLIINGDNLVISNPGGLYGMTVTTLGLTAPQSRNDKLSSICQYVYSANGNKVVEKLGTGIPNIKLALENANLKPAEYIDQGIRFTAKIDSKRILSQNKLPLDNAQKILKLLKSDELTRKQLQQLTQLTPSQVRRALETLIDDEKITFVGKRNSPYAKYKKI